MLARGAQVLRDPRGGAAFGPEQAVGLVEFRLAATDEQFPTIAKLRAARRLWARVLELSGADASRRPAAARGHQPADDEQVRPLGEHAAHHGRRLRRRCRRSRRGHRAAVRRARSACPTRSAAGSPATPRALLIEESHVAAVADPAGGAYAVEKLTDDLAARGLGRARPARGRRRGRLRRPRSRDGRRHAASDAGRHAAAGRSPGSASSRTSPRRCPSASRRRDRRRPPLRRRRSRRCATSPPTAHVFLATLAPSPQHTARADLRDQPARRRRHRRRRRRRDDGVDDLVAAYDGQAGRLPGRHRRGVRRVGDRGRRARCATPGAESGDRRRQAGRRLEADDSCALGVDALDFLTRTREKLA